ncbi:ABC transporter ATP-binding protein [Celerinatantimonas sp. YJH-8]|uniref:ABC transporter ATP-binding protein n=1 Tax=Celerinatantimonas sp. YJH-8 TaxID=3228714 RepID=UPI0038BF0104
MTDILEVRQLTKFYQDKVAVDHIDFSLKKGQCFGLLGPNGAGKTTTIEILEGVLEADSGDILFQGQPRGKSYRQAIGIQFQNTALQDHLNVREVLQLFSRLYVKPQSIDFLLESCALTEFVDRNTKQLSGGQRQRLLLAIALINNPDILFLDEPTTGLDPQARMNFWSLVESIKASGKTVLLTTHYMDEAHYLCDEIGILDRGQLIALDTPKSLLDQYIPGTYLSVSELYQPLLEKLNIQSETRYGWCRWKSETVDQQVEQLKAVGLSQAEIQVQRPNLDDLFLTLTGHSLRS